MSELQPEEMLLTVAATITESEIETMISSSELSQLIKEPVLSKVPKCTAEGCWYGIVENEDKTLGSCPVCLGRGVVANTVGF
jgi:hypothetical protein